MRQLEFPVFLLTDAGQKGPNFVLTPQRDMLVVCRNLAGAIWYGVKARELGVKEPKSVAVQDLETFRGIVGSVVDALPAMKWILVYPHPSIAPARMRISTFLKVKGEPRGR